MAHQDGVQLSALAIGLRALGDKLPPKAAEDAFIRIIEVIAQTQNSVQLRALAHGLGTLGKNLRDATAERALQLLLGYFRPLEEPPCALAKSLASRLRLECKPHPLQPSLGGTVLRRG